MKKLLENRWVLLMILALTWGSSFILIKKSLLVFSPFQIGSFRVGISGLILSYFGISALRKMDKKTMIWIAGVGFFGNFLPMYLFPIAQTQVSSSLAGILDSLVPVFVLVLGFLIFGVRSKSVQVVGALMGFVGALLLMVFTELESGESSMFHSLLIVLATVSYALAGLIIKERLNHVPSMQLSSAVFTVWMVPSLLILVFSGFFSEFQNAPEVWDSLGYLSILTVMGTAIAAILYYRLIQQTSAVFASSVTYLMPLVAVIWGILDGEELSIWFGIGGALILWGIYLIREKKPVDRPVPR